MSRLQGSVVLKKGPIVTPHFAHRPAHGCDFGEGETEEHRQAKTSLYDLLVKRLGASEVELECSIYEKDGVEVARPDIGAVIRGEPVAFEIQRSNLTIPKITHRTETYARFGVAVMWIAIAREELYWDLSLRRAHGEPHSADIGKNQFSPRAWERWLHAAYRDRVHYWRTSQKHPEPGFNPIVAAHFKPHMIEVERRDWYDEHGDEQSAGGYDRFSKRWRDVVLSEPIDVVDGCKSVQLKAFSWDGGGVPVRKLWMQK